MSRGIHESWSKVSDRIPDSLKEYVSKVAKDDKFDIGKADDALFRIIDRRAGLDSLREIKSAGKDCNRMAKETVHLCTNTIEKGKQMTNFGKDIKSTLVTISDNLDASVFETIKDLIDGDQSRAAMNLAGEMDDLAIACVKKSMAMISRMEEGLDNLPGVVKDVIEQQAFKSGGDEYDPELANIEPDMQDLKKCIDAVSHLNLFTAMEAGVNAFDSLSAKADVCRTMFDAIKGFALAIVTITDAFIVHDVDAVVSSVKDMFRCIRLSGLMKQFSEQAGKLIKKIIELFKKSSEKMSRLWSALAFAKECLSDCATHALDARRLCVDASDKGCQLVVTSTEIKRQLENVKSLKSLNSGGLSSLKALVQGSDVRHAIDLATSMDDLVKDCIEKVICMIDRVTEGFNNLPDIIKEGVPDVREAGTADDDPEPANVELDIEEVNRSRGEIESANVFSAVSASVKGFSEVSTKVALCNSMLEAAQSFAESCINTIDSFMGAWNLETAMDRIVEMCRLVVLGEMMKQFAEQTLTLVETNIALLQAAKHKLSKVDVNDLTSDDIENAVKQAGDMVNKFKLWRK